MVTKLPAAPTRLLTGIVAGLSLVMPPSAAGHAAAPAASMPALVPSLDWIRLPSGQVLGEITAVAIDRQDNLWILHRPRSVRAEDRGRAAPPVLAFDREGNFLRGFGGPGQGYDWPTTEHSLDVDGSGQVWIAGSFRTDAASADDMILCFSGEGRFLRQIGRRGGSRGSADTLNVHAPGDLFVDDETAELYVADGYGNRRIIVFDTESGAFKRMWGAFGAPPLTDPAPAPRTAGAFFVAEGGRGPVGFNGVHGVEVARDGLVYVSDRNNQRIQVFDRRGRYRAQFFVDRNQPSPQSASGIALSRDRGQKWLYVADWGNSRLLVFDRARRTLLGGIGMKGANPGLFTGPHLIATDSHGTLYVAEVQGRRVQRLAAR